MSSDWDLSGLDELVDLCEEMDISDAKERKALNVGGDILLKSAIENAPDLTGYTEKSIKKKITKNDDGDKCVKISVNAWDGVFSEYGSSKNKSHIGWFENSIDNNLDEAIQSMKDVILK